MYGDLESLKPFLVNFSILYLLKTPGNESFSNVFRWYKMEICNGQKWVNEFFMFKFCLELLKLLKANY